MKIKEKLNELDLLNMKQNVIKTFAKICFYFCFIKYNILIIQIFLEIRNIRH